MPLARINRPATRPDGRVIAHIVALNIARRHLRKEQQAMAMAVLYPEPEKGGRGQNRRVNLRFDKTLLSKARTVLAHSPDAAKAVLAGTKHLDVAYQEAVKARQEDQGDDAKLARLRSLVPDVAAMVEDERQSRFSKNGTKRAVVAFCRDRGLKLTNDNAADACVVWWWHRQRTLGIAPCAGPLWRKLG